MTHLPEIVRRRPLAVLLLFCFLAWLPGFFTLPPLDRDESRFAQATKQMLETGDFVNINLGQGSRYEKPVGIYWMQAASTAILGSGARDRIWTYRVPSLLGAIAAVAGTFWLARAIGGVETAFWAGMLLGFSLLLTAESKIAKTDAALLATIVAAQGVLMRAYLSARDPGRWPPPSLALALFGWAAFGLGVLVKGPIVALVCGATVAALVIWDRDGRWLARLHPLPGLGVALAVVLPWAVAIGIVSHGAFYQASLGGDFATKLVGEQETHGAPPGYFAVLMHLSFWPASFALLPGIVVGIARRREPAIRYLLLWAGTTWLMFEAVPTKLPHYVLPAFPALAALSALWLTGAEAASAAERVGRLVSHALFLAIAVALAGFLVWAPSIYGGQSPWWLYVLSGTGVLAALGSVALGKGRTFAAAAACLSALILYTAAGFGTAPRLTALWLSSRMAEAVARHAASGDPSVATAGYAEPSIAFLLGTKTRLTDGAQAGGAAATEGGLVLVDESEQQPFMSAVEKGGAKAQALEMIDGLNYSRGRATHITLYRVVPPPR